MRRQHNRGCEKARDQPAHHSSQAQKRKCRMKNDRIQNEKFGGIAGHLTTARAFRFLHSAFLILNFPHMASETKVQAFVHALEEGGWVGKIRFALLAAAVAAVYSLFIFANFRGLSHPKAMDQAQIAREIARGNGFSTKFIRPAGGLAVPAIQGGDAGRKRARHLQRAASSADQLGGRPVDEKHLADERQRHRLRKRPHDRRPANRIFPALGLGEFLHGQAAV